MIRILKYAGVFLAVLLLLLVMIWLWLFNTGSGKRFLLARALPMAEQAVEQNLGSEILVGDISGRLPGELILEDIRLSGPEGEWFSADRAALRWRPFALFNRHIYVDSFSLTGGNLSGKPPQKEQSGAESEQGNGGLPGSLPRITVSELDIPDFNVADSWFGSVRTFTLHGKLQTAGRQAEADFFLEETLTSEKLDLIAGRDGNRLSVELDVQSPANGLIASLAKAGGPVDLTLIAEGPLSGWEGTLNGSAGTYGTAAFDLSGRYGSDTDLSLNLAGEFSAGPALPQPAREALGASAVLDATLTRDAKKLTLALNRIDIAAGKFDGTAKIDDLVRPISGSDIFLQGTVSTAFAKTAGAPQLAGENALTLFAEDGGFGGRWSLPQGSVEAKNFTRTGDDWKGHVSFSVSDPAGLHEAAARLSPYMVSGGSDIVWRENGTLSLSGLSVQLTGKDAPSSTAVITADGDISVSEKKIRQSGSVTMSSSFITGYAEHLSLTTPVSAKIDVTGDFDALSVKLEGDMPAGSYDGTGWTAGALALSAETLPKSPQGMIDLVAADGSYHLQGDWRYLPQSGALSISRLDAGWQGATLAGSVNGQISQDSLEADVIFDLPPGTDLPGIGAIAAKGQFRARMNSAGSAAALSLEADVEDFAFRDVSFRKGGLSVSGPSRTPEYTGEFDSVSLPGGQQFSSVSLEGAADLRDGLATQLRKFTVLKTADKQFLALYEPANINWIDRVLSVSPVALTLPSNGQTDLSLRYGRDAILVKGTVKNILTPYSVNPLDGEIDLDTARAQPGTFRITMPVTRADGGKSQVKFDGNWSGKLLSASFQLDKSSIARLSLPLSFHPGSGISTGSGQIDGRVQFTESFTLLDAIVPTDLSAFSGNVSTDIALGGTLLAPQADGGLSLSGVRFEEPVTGAALTDISGEARFLYGGTSNQVTLNFTAADATGTKDSISLTGQGNFNGGQQPAIEASLKMNNATLISSPELTAKASTDLALKGTLSDLLLSGVVQIENLDALIPEFQASKNYVPVDVRRVDGVAPADDQTGENAPEKAFALNLDLTVIANNRLFVRGRGLTSEWKADLSVTGTHQAPVVKGVIESLDGTLDFAGREFTLGTGIIRFTGAGLIPQLDMETTYSATTNGEAFETAIEISGPASQPEIALTSTPSLPQDEVMALILFGKRPTQLTAYESLRIAEAVASLSGASPFGGGTGLSGQLRHMSGLDELNFDQGTDGSAGSVSAGKYISDDVYVAARQSLDGTGNQVTVTWEVNDNLNVETTVEQDGTQNVSANYKKDY